MHSQFFAIYGVKIKNSEFSKLIKMEEILNGGKTIGYSFSLK